MSEKQIYTNKDTNIANLKTDSRANQNPKRYDKNGVEILWEGKKKYHPVGLFLFIAFWCGGGLAIWTMWHFMRVESLWYGVPLICFVGIACLFGYYCINLRKIYLTTKGLWIHTRFNGDIFYPYGYFVVHYMVGSMISFAEFDTIHSPQKSSKTFMFPVVRGSMGVFMNNDDFKRICSKQTQKALESMSIKDIVNLYDNYTNYAEPKRYFTIKHYFPTNDMIHNVFVIDFSLYRQELECYLDTKVPLICVAWLRCKKKINFIFKGAK
ncbi:hypothetical protein [Helicobacter sp. T3_23-1056]